MLSFLHWPSGSTCVEILVSGPNMFQKLISLLKEATGSLRSFTITKFRLRTNIPGPLLCLPSFHSRLQVPTTTLVFLIRVAVQTNLKLFIPSLKLRPVHLPILIPKFSCFSSHCYVWYVLTNSIFMSLCAPMMDSFVLFIFLNVLWVVELVS